MTDFNQSSKNAHIDEREQRRRRREVRRAAMAQAHSSIAPISTSTVTENHHREPVVDVDRESMHGDASYKSESATFQPESHHSVDASQQSSSPDDDLGSDLFRHPARASNATTFCRTQLTKIDFPPPNASVWKIVNSELETALPAAFPKHKIKSTPIEDLSPKFDNWLHAFFLERFGTRKVKPKRNHNRSARKNKMMVFLRERKKECRRVWRTLVKAGLQDSPEGKDVHSHWMTLVRRHNKLRKQLAIKQQRKDRDKASAEFRKDPHKFAKQLLGKPKNNGKPTFSKEDCQAYFSKTYRDEGRHHLYTALDGQSRPTTPNYDFKLRCPTLKELLRITRRKRNGAAPGFNSLTYVPYKKCRVIMEYVHMIGCRIFKARDIPADWAEAFVILLAKSDKLDVVSEFRPIALTCTIGKIFFSCIANRLQKFMIKNTYINREIQKGFLSGISGCLEHSFALYQALREAKEHTRQIVVTWIDLANAYGSVRHNLIQFALNWYHVPRHIQEIIFKYYEKLRATVESNGWSTGFFLFDIGLFQGCVLSAILFDCVFQLLLDFLSNHDKLGYTYKLATRDGKPITTLSKAYADDLSLVTRNAKDNQIALNATDTWLDWSGTMKAKPRKCVSLGMRQFDRRVKRHSFDPVFPELTYSPFDPRLTIAGKPIKFLYDPDNKEKSEFEREHFKFLGRHQHFWIKEQKVKAKIRSDFLTDLQKINDCKVTGFCKAWLYQHAALQRHSWAFLVHDLDRSFALDLSAAATSNLKNWIGIYKTAEPGILFRSKDNFGLGLTPVIDHFERMQVVKCQILQHSVCEDIRAIYSTRAKLESAPGRKWRFTRANAEAAAQVELASLFQSQSGRQGLGRGHFKAVLSSAEKRKLASAFALQFSQERRIVHSLSLARQGAWLDWSESTTPFDFSWHNLIFGLSDELFKFVLHSSINWIKTPDLMFLWSKSLTANCPLCSHKVCSIHHIISSCSFALEDKRYTWRHDSVLSVMASEILPYVNEFNKSNRPNKIPHITQSFVKSGKKSFVKKTPCARRSFLEGASDWKVQVDYDHAQVIFPPTILATSSRPDIVFWSISAKKVILLELTCPAEEGISDAHLRKLERYSELMSSIKAAGWSPSHYPIEVGARGFVARSTQRCLSALGLSPSAKKKLTRALSLIAARCSYAIYLSRGTVVWDRNMPLLGHEC